MKGIIHLPSPPHYHVFYVYFDVLFSIEIHETEILSSSYFVVLIFALVLKNFCIKFLTFNHT